MKAIAYMTFGERGKSTVTVEDFGGDEDHMHATASVNAWRPLVELSAVEYEPSEVKNLIGASMVDKEAEISKAILAAAEHTELVGSAQRDHGLFSRLVGGKFVLVKLGKGCDMSQRPGSFVNAAGILANDNPADVRKLDAAREADVIEVAPPGTDLRGAILQLCDDALHMKDPGDTVNAYNRVLALIDASPNGGSDAYITLQRVDVKRLLAGDENSPGYVLSRRRISDCMQATSAEVKA